MCVCGGDSHLGSTAVTRRGRSPLSPATLETQGNGGGGVK